MATYKVIIKEERTTDVYIEADTREEAWESANHQYDNDELFYSQFNDADIVDIYVLRTPIKED